MKKINLINFSGKIKILTLFVYLLFVSGNTIVGQEVIISKENKEFLEILSPSVVQESNLEIFIDRVGYKIPKYISIQQWNQFPLLRQIEMMVISAENANRGIGGRNLLSELAKFKAQQYEAISFDPRLKSLLEAETPKEIEFKKLRKKYKRNLPVTAKNQIYTISKYLNVGALGGPQTVMAYHFGLSNDIIYEIIATSNSYLEVFEKGLAMSKVPPAHQQRIIEIVKQLQNSYESSSLDAKLNKILKDNKPFHNNSPTYQESFTYTLNNNDAFNHLSKADRKLQATQVFNTYTRNTFETGKVSNVFLELIQKSSGPGGVVMGNRIIDRTNLPDIKQILFIRDKILAKDGLQTGSLEFIFSDDRSITIPNLYIEDIIAAYNLIHKSEYDYKDGKAITLASIESISSNNSMRFEVTLNPEIAHQRLGWSALLCDAYPIAHADFLKNFEDKEDSIVEDIYKNIKDTYKIIDVPLEVALNENRIELGRTKNSTNKNLKDIYLTMQVYDCMDEAVCEGKENIEFYNAMPDISDNIIEFYRLNKFAKTLAILRWAKEKKGDIVKLPTTELDEFFTPFSLFINSAGEFKNLTLDQEIDFFRDLYESKINQIETMVDFGLISPELFNIHKDHHKLYLEENKKNWSKIKAYIGDDTLERPMILNSDTIFKSVKSNKDYENYNYSKHNNCNRYGIYFGPQPDEQKRNCKSKLKFSEFFIENFRYMMNALLNLYSKPEQNLKELLVGNYNN